MSSYASSSYGSAFSTSSHTLVDLLKDLATGEGYRNTHLPEVRVMRATYSIPRSPVTYDPSIVIVAQGRKRGYLGAQSYAYDANNYLVLSVPLPFECETEASPENPMLGVSVRVNPATIAELIMDQDHLPTMASSQPKAIYASPLTEELSDATVRLLKCLKSPVEARILGQQIVREITYRVLCGEQGCALRALATPHSNFSQIARALRRIHADYAKALDVALLAREAGMSVSTFHANFKAVTTNSPLRYIQTIRLHKAQMLMLHEGANASTAARLVGYESPSQFSREFKDSSAAAPLMWPGGCE
jgi:AraC-like DNA-binding protein